MRHAIRPALLTILLLGVVACKEEPGGIEVASLSFEGVKAVSEDQLESVLATRQSARLPWGTKRYFRREQFEADLKRIEAFYADRGYPDARVKSFDVKPSDDQSSVGITVVIDEGEPILVERIVLEGFEPLPDEHEKPLSSQLPLRV
jgi:outer membrane protein assembly factor BamA